MIQGNCEYNRLVTVDMGEFSLHQLLPRHAFLITLTGQSYSLSSAMEYHWPKHWPNIIFKSNSICSRKEVIGVNKI